MAVLIDSQTIDTSGTAGVFTGAGQSLYSGNFPSGLDSTYILDSVVYKTVRGGSPTGNAYAKIYLASGVYGDNNIPSGAALATSDAIDVSTISTELQEITFSFSGSNRILLEDPYLVITIEFENPTTLNYISFRSSGTNQHEGNYCTRSSGVWSPNSNKDLYFKLYGNLYGPTVGNKYPLPAFKK